MKTTKHLLDNFPILIQKLQLTNISNSNSNVYDKIESCFERFDSYIDQKISAKNCPNSHARAKRVLTRMNGRMRKAAEARTKRMLSAGLRKQNVEGKNFRSFELVWNCRNKSPS